MIHISYGSKSFTPNQACQAVQYFLWKRVTPFDVDFGLSLCRPFDMHKNANNTIKERQKSQMHIMSSLIPNKMIINLTDKELSLIN